MVYLPFWMWGLQMYFIRGTLQSFDLVCELFSYSDEKIDTGIEEIDDIEEQQSFVRTFELNPSPQFLVLSKLVKLSQVVLQVKLVKLRKMGFYNKVSISYQYD